MSRKPAQPDTGPIDHIGWGLSRAARAWKRRFVRRMVVRGYPWYGEARGTLIQHIGRQGIAQAALPRRAGMTKQAVQQLLDELCADGVVERVADPDDARRKLVRFTRAGLDALRAADEVKRSIEGDIRAAIGAEELDSLKSTLARLAGMEEDETSGS